MADTDDKIRELTQNLDVYRKAIDSLSESNDKLMAQRDGAVAEIEHLREQLELSGRKTAEYQEYETACHKIFNVQMFVNELVTKKTWLVRGVYVISRLNQILNSNVTVTVTGVGSSIKKS